MLSKISCRAVAHVEAAVAELGRTEDVRFSPGNRRLAVAAFTRNRLVVFDVEIVSVSGAPRVTLTGGLALTSPALHLPHGVDFLDDDTVVVTSRGGDVALFTLPRGGPDLPTRQVAPLARWPANATTHLDAPSSVAVTRVDDRGGEILVCNNAGHTVTRHALDRSGALRHSEILLRRDLGIPDGISVSADHRWMAISNHVTRNVLLYERPDALHPDAEAVGLLRGPSYPHGLRFTADGRHLLVADAGAPYLHVYAAGPQEWRGVRDPIGRVRIMEDAVFQRGRANPEEGGLKGLDLDRTSSVLVVTCECAPLAFFHVARLLAQAHAARATDEERALDLQLELSRMRGVRALAEEAAGARALQRSVSWRITAPLRRLRAAWGRKRTEPASALFERPREADG